jgi:hypothetical protein
LRSFLTLAISPKNFLLKEFYGETQKEKSVFSRQNTRGGPLIGRKVSYVGVLEWINAWMKNLFGLY